MYSDDNSFAFVDLCGTLVDRNTITEYIRYAFDHGIIKASRRRRYLWGRALVRTGYLGGFTYKKELIWFLRGIERSKLEDLSERFYFDVCEPNLNLELISALDELRRNGVRPVIVSAALDVYVNHIAKQLSISDVVCSRLKWEGEICAGVLDGRDCMGNQKVDLLRKRYTISPEVLANSYAFGDSLSDLPLLEFVGNPFAIWPNPQLLSIAKERAWPIGVHPVIDGDLLTRKRYQSSSFSP